MRCQQSVGSTAMVREQTGVKPAAFPRVTTRKERPYGRAVFPRIKQEGKCGRLKYPDTIY